MYINLNIYIYMLIYTQQLRICVKYSFVFYIELKLRKFQRWLDNDPGAYLFYTTGRKPRIILLDYT